MKYSPAWVDLHILLHAPFSLAKAVPEIGELLGRHGQTVECDVVVVTWQKKGEGWKTKLRSGKQFKRVY